MNPLSKIHDFQIDLITYYLRGKFNLFPDLVDCPQKDCLYKRRLRKHGFYERNAISFDQLYIIPIQRYLCPVCRHTVSLIPSFLAPRFQYTVGHIYALLCFYVLGGMTLIQAASRIGKTCSYQHLIFYKRRCLDNANIYKLALNQLGFGESTSKDFLSYWLVCIGKLDIEAFNLAFFEIWQSSFLRRQDKNIRLV